MTQGLRLLAGPYLPLEHALRTRPLPRPEESESSGGSKPCLEGRRRFQGERKAADRRSQTESRLASATPPTPRQRGPLGFSRLPSATDPQAKTPSIAYSGHLHLADIWGRPLRSPHSGDGARLPLKHLLTSLGIHIIQPSLPDPLLPASCLLSSSVPSPSAFATLLTKSLKIYHRSVSPIQPICLANSSRTVAPTITVELPFNPTPPTPLRHYERKCTI